MRVRHNYHCFLHLLAAACLLAACTPAVQAQNAQLQSVLNSIDRASHVQTITADAESREYTKAVDDTTVEHGRMYFRKTRTGPELALDLSAPAARKFIYRNQTGWLYQPGVNQVQRIDLRKNQSLVEQFLLLGLGGSGHGMTKSFQITVAGHQRINRADTMHLHMVPTAPQLLGKISGVDLWYDTRNWIAIQQQVFQPSGDYKLLNYTNVKLGGRVPGSEFNTNFPGAAVIQH